MHSNVLYGQAAPQDTGQRGVFLVSTVGPSTLQLCLAEHTGWVSWRALALGPPDVVVRLSCTQATLYGEGQKAAIWLFAHRACLLP